MISTLLTAVIVIAIVGVVVWAVQTMVPLPTWARTLITAVCIIFALLALLHFVVGGHLPAWR